MALISSNHYSNNGIIEKFIRIDIFSNYAFLLLVASPVTGDPHGSQRINFNSADRGLIRVNVSLLRM